MGLAGEALVQTHRLRPLVDALWRLKARQTGLMETLQNLEDRLSDHKDTWPAAERELLTTTLARAAQSAQGLDETIEGMEELRVSAKTSPAACIMKC